MSTAEVTLFFALLAVAAELAVGVAVAVWIAARISPRAARWREQLSELLGSQTLALAFIVATAATAGSLYLSEVAGFRPCKLCWYQRAAMYPLVPALLVGVLRPVRWLRRGVVAVALAGGSVSVYHILIERFPSLEGAACDPANPCSLIWVERFGYLTIPTMALSAFLLIAVLASPIFRPS